MKRRTKVLYLRKVPKELRTSLELSAERNLRSLSAEGEVQLTKALKEKKNDNAH